MDKVDINLLFGTPEGKRSLQQLETAPTIAAAAALLLGVLLCCAGARFVKQATLGCAFLDGAVGISLVLQRVHLLTGDDDADVGTADWENVASWACFFLGGTLLCLLVLANAALGRFVVGMTAGLVLALVCNTTFGYRLNQGHPHIALLGLLCGLGALCGLVTARSSSSSSPGGKAVIVATSWIGANAMAWGAGYFIGNYPNGASLDKYRRQQADDHHQQYYAIPKAWWGYLASTIVCCALGCLIQHCAACHQLRKNKRRLQLRATHNNYTCAGTPRRGAQNHPFPH